MIWKEFESSGFFSSLYNFGLMLNVDWFRPFKRSEYKVAAIMLTVLDLPREERFKKQWTILAGETVTFFLSMLHPHLLFSFIIGIIPGLHEPTGHINTFLKPLVDDLLNLWSGIDINDGGPQKVRAALLCVTSDLPAVRKVTQFLGHKADLGCSRCKFRAEREPGSTGASGKMSYFTSSSSARRTHEEVVDQGREFQRAPTKAAAAQIAKTNGVRYSELLRLPYFDIVRMSTTDPMHTFLLGLVKKETELNLNLLSVSQKREFIRRVKSVRIPYDVGRLPTNVFDQSEGVTDITADQWKTYIVCYARPCLYKLLPDRAYKSLVLLAEIVTIIASPIFTPTLFQLCIG